MFLETYRLTQSRVSKLQTLLIDYRKGVTPATVRQNGGPIVREIALELHYLTEDETAKALLHTLPEWSMVQQEVSLLIHNLRQQGYGDLYKCPVCEDEHKEEEAATPKGAIDRPPMPRPALFVTPETVVAFMRELRPWLQETAFDLFEDTPPAYLDLAPRPDRYTIADHHQVRNLAQWFSDAHDIAARWDQLVNNEGPEWSSDRVGLQRLQLLERAKAIYVAISNPAVNEEHAHRGFLGLLGAFFGGPLQ